MSNNISPEEGNNLSGNKSKAFSCFDCSLLTKRNSMYYCQRWSCYKLKKSIKFWKDYNLNTHCIPYSRLFANIITIAKLRTIAPLSGTPENSIQKFQENIWKNGLNSVTLKQLDNIINDIQNGRIETDISRRLRRIAVQSSRFQLPRTDNGRMVEYNYQSGSESIPIIAAQICGGSSGATYKSPHSYIRESCLAEWAKHAGYWIESIAKHAKSKGWRRAKELDGTESMIYTTSENRIVKIWSMKNYFYNLSLGVEKIILHNFLFGTDAYLNVIGFTKIKGFLYFVLEQPIINYIEESFNGIAIRKFLENKFPNGHVDLDKGQFNVYLPEIFITDLHARNVVRMSKESDFIVIDCNIMFKNTTLGSLYNYYNCKVNPLILNSISDLDAIISKANDMIDAFAYTGYYPRSHEEAMIQRYWKDIKKQCNQRKRELKTFLKSPLFTNLIKLLKIRNKTTKKIHTK